MLIFKQSVVSGCSFKEPDDPGNLEIDWMEVQLEMYRNRGMQVRSVQIEIVCTERYVHRFGFQACTFLW